MNNMQFGSDLDEGIRCFSGKLYFLKFSLCSHIPLGFCSSKWWKENIGPLSCEPPHLHFNGSSFKFWEISNNPGTFSEFLPRSDAKTRRMISPPRKMICTVLCIRCQGKSLPSFEDANGIEFFTRLWQEAELNWQSKLMLYWSNTPNPWRHEDILKKT